MGNRLVSVKLLLLMIIIILLVVPFQVIAEKKLQPVMTLSFSEVEPLMVSRYQVIVDNNKAYSDLNSGQRNIQTGANYINDLLIDLNNIKAAGSPDPAIEDLIDVVASLVQAQAQMAVGQNSMAQSTSIVNTGLQTEKGNFTIVWNMESMFITYHSLQHQIEDLSAKEPLLEKQLNAAKLQKELGMATENYVLNAESQLTELRSGIQQLEEAQKAIKHTFNVNLAQEYDTDINILDVPDVTTEEISSIKVDEDYKEALNKSYDVRLYEQKDIDKENDAKRNFKKGFYKAYQTILDKQLALKSEMDKYRVAERNMKATDLKYKLGMISTIQYQAENSSFITMKMSLAKAKDSLFQAYHAYQWAKRGLIVTIS